MILFLPKTYYVREGTLPFQLSILLLIPQLPAIYQVLPDDIGSWGYGSEGVEESEGEPNAHDGILLPQSLTGTDAIAIMTSDRLADAELDETNQERNDE